MERQPDKEVSNFWPFIGAAFLAVANVDWVLAPVFRYFIPSFWVLYVVISVFANAEIIAWYKFWRWFITSFLPNREKIKKTINFAEGLSKEIKREGHVERVVEYFEDSFKWAANPENYIFRIIKTGGHFGMLFLGFEPIVSGGRLAGVIFCAMTGWKNGLYSLCIGNLFHVLALIGYWELSLYLFYSFRNVFYILIAFFIIYAAVKIYVKSRSDNRLSDK